MAVGAARPAIRRRKPDGCCHQYRRGGGCEVTARRLHAPLRHFGKRDQCYGIRKAQFQLHARHRAGCSDEPLAPCSRSTSDIPANNLAEFISYAKANPGKISLASFGTATVSHLAGELFKAMTGINLLHVPYRGTAPMLSDLLGGQVQASFDNLAGSIEFIKLGKLRPLAITSTTRSDKLPEVPALHEFLPDFEASAWGGVGAPKNTP